MKYYYIYFVSIISMLKSNIDEYDINIDINISDTQRIVVNLSKETGYLTIIDNLNSIIGEPTPLNLSSNLSRI